MQGRRTPYEMVRCYEGDPSLETAKYSSCLPSAGDPTVLREPSLMFSSCGGTQFCIEKWLVLQRLHPGHESHTCHHFRPSFQGAFKSMPAFTIRPLIPAPNRRPKTVSKNRVTTSWSRGESRSVCEDSLSTHNARHQKVT